MVKTRDSLERQAYLKSFEHGGEIGNLLHPRAPGTCGYGTLDNATGTSGHAHFYQTLLYIGGGNGTIIKKEKKGLPEL